MTCIVKNTRTDYFDPAVVWGNKKEGREGKGRKRGREGERKKECNDIKLKSVRVHFAYGSDGQSFFVEYSS